MFLTGITPVRLAGAIGSTAYSPYAGLPKGLTAQQLQALTNRAGGTTDELLELARTIRGGVLARFGIELTPEPILVGCSL